MRLQTTLAVIGALGLGATLLLGQSSGVADHKSAQETYFASGQVESRIHYVDGRRGGLGERFYADGKPQAKGRYENGRMEGEWQFWNADGSIDDERSGHYAHGDKVAPGGLESGS